MSEKIKVILSPSSENPFAVIYKPSLLPSAPLFEGDESALTQSIKLFPQIKNVRGVKDVEYGLVHRIDTATRGLLLIAATNESYENFMRQQAEGSFIKGYTARIRESFAKLEGMTYLKEDALQKIKASLLKDGRTDFFVESFFRSWGKGSAQVRPVFEWSNAASKKKCGKTLYRTDIELLKKDGVFTARCFLKKGFRHQVRAHLCASGFPILGDSLYDAEKKDGDEFLFEATSLSFIHPLTKKKVSFVSPENIF